MTELERYLAEEVAEDHVDGIITRREAMRRLALLGVGATAAAAMITAEAEARKRGKNRRRSRPRPRPRARSRRRRQDDRLGAGADASDQFAGPRGNAAGGVGAGRGQGQGRRARDPREPRPDRAHPQRRGPLRANGFSALALDLLSEEGGTGRAARRRRARQPRSPAADPKRFDEDMKAAVTEIEKRVGRARADLRDRLLLRRRHDLAPAGRARDAAVGRRAVLRPVPGGPRAPTLKGIKANVLGVYGGMDTRVNATRAGRRRRARGGAAWTTRSSRSPRPSHAFFNDTGGPAAAFNAPAAEEAWRRVNDWFASRDRN